MDWNSLANAGMGGANMRKVLMETNKTLGDNGVLMDASIKQYGSFRDSLTSGWLTADTFNKSMKVMAGQTLKSGKTVAYTVEQLQKMGYSKDAAKELNKLSQAAIDSATKIKTFTQLIDVVKESIGSGWAKIFHGMIGEGMGQVVLNSPAGQLFLAEGGRFQNAVSQMTKFMSPWEPGTRTQEEALMVVNEIAKISSGWNNAMKMKQALALKKSLDKNGVLIDPTVNNAEAVMQLFGFATGDTRKMYESQRIVIEGTKKHRDEVMEAYKAAKQYHQSKFEAGITNPAQQQAVIGQMLMMYKDDPTALGIINKEWSKDSMGKDQMLFMGMIKNIGLPEFSMTVDQIKQAPISADQKEILIQRLSDVKNARTEINKGK